MFIKERLVRKTWSFRCSFLNMSIFVIPLHLSHVNKYCLLFQFQSRTDCNTHTHIYAHTHARTHARTHTHTHRGLGRAGGGGGGGGYLGRFAATLKCHTETLRSFALSRASAKSCRLSIRRRRKRGVCARTRTLRIPVSVVSSRSAVTGRVKTF